VGNLLPIPSSDGLRILKTLWGPYPVVSPLRVVKVATQPVSALRRAA